MQEIVPFILHHWFLCALLLVCVIALLVVELRGRVGGIQALSPQKAITLINHEDAVVLDIRPQDVFIAGHVMGAVNIPFGNIVAWKNKIERYQAKPIIVCGSHPQDQSAAAAFKKQGFQTVYILAGGLSAWQTEGLPLEKGKNE